MLVELSMSVVVALVAAGCARHRVGSRLSWVIGSGGLVVICAAAALACVPSASAATLPDQKQFAYSSTSQQFTVPSGVTQLHIEAWGGSGGAGAGSSGEYSAPGGLGADVTMELPVTPGDVLTMEVGGQGGNANGTSAGSGGGDGQGDAPGGPGGNVNGVSGQATAGGGGGGATVITGPDNSLVLFAGGGGGGGGAGGFAGYNGGVGGDAGSSTNDQCDPVRGTGEYGSGLGGGQGGACSQYTSARAGLSGSGQPDNADAGTGGGGGGGADGGNGGASGSTDGGGGGGGGAGTTQWSQNASDVIVGNGSPGQDGGVIIQWVPAGQGGTIEHATYSTDTTFTVPAGVDQVSLSGWGGSGGQASDGDGDGVFPAIGGLGARLSTVVNVNPGDKLELSVGGAGGDGTYENKASSPVSGGKGGGSSSEQNGGSGGSITNFSGGGYTGATGGGGGGATVVTDETTGQMVLDAGGGGGAGGDGSGNSGLNGGEGGNAGSAFATSYGPFGNGLDGSGGSAAGDSNGAGGIFAIAGAPAGQSAANDAISNGASTGGGGGGGTGGGTAGGQCTGNLCAGSSGGGGGGNSAFGTQAQDTRAGNSVGGGGGVTITWVAPVAPQITSGDSATFPSFEGLVDYFLTATGSPAPTFSLSRAPSWLTIDPTFDKLEGIIPPGTNGVFKFNVVASNGVSPDAVQPFTLDIAGSPIAFTPPGTLQAVVSVPFSATLDAAGGTSPYTWSVASGSLPAGLTLSSSGVISGTPSAKGTSTFTAKVTDSSTPTAVVGTESVTIQVAPRVPTITTTSLPAGRVGQAYSQTLAERLAVKPLKWSVSSGKLPAGLSLNASTGVISGTPTAAGTSSFTVKLKDATGLTATAKLSLTVDPGVQAAVYVAQGGYSGVESFALDATGNVMPLSSISGSATGLEGTRAVTIDPTGRVYIASLSNSEIAEYAYETTGDVAPSSAIAGSATQLAGPAGMAISPSGKLYVANSQGDSITVYAAGASGNATPVAVISGSQTALDQPEALTFDNNGNLWVANQADNLLTEYPADANGNVPPSSFISGSNTGLDGPSAITLDSEGNLLVANTYGGSLTEYSPSQADNVPPLRTISGSLTGLQGNFPDGVDVDTNGNIYVANEFAGLEEFSPTASGNQAPIADVYGSATGLSAPQGIAVAPPLSVRTAKLPAARVGHHYRKQLEANLGTTPYHWTLVKGKLPAGMKLARDGILTGVPKHTGRYRFTVKVRDSSHPRMTATRVLVLVVKQH